VWQVVLPEGSTVTKVKAPFFVEESSDTKYTYLDTDGRPVVVIKKKNVVFEHNVVFVVEYTFSTIHLVPPLSCQPNMFTIYVGDADHCRPATTLASAKQGPEFIKLSLLVFESSQEWICQRISRRKCLLCSF